jgi:UDP-galactopyranose mutase
MARTPLVVFSHLRWDFVFQRPQHVLSRIARRRPVLFVEEPIASAGQPRLELVPAAPGLEVARPLLEAQGPGFGEAQEAVITDLLRSCLRDKGWTRFAAWLYTPMAVRIARALEPIAIVYDCMDELSAFLGAPPELLERERELIQAAGAVFTGGPSLFEAKRALHPAVHCFPSSVDTAHFAQARTAVDPGDQASLPHTRLGYFGVIDERIDLAILERLADAHPEWSIVMVGPVVKIDPASLPRRANLHVLGQKPYAELPAYAGGWDVCLMPFAINRATRFISPTKVLEYMAAERPIASTPIHDVVAPYGEIVYLGEGPDGFVAACERALSASDAERGLRRDGAQQVLRRTSWDETAERMDEILESLTAGAAEPSPGAAYVEGARS